jgi:peptidoglycan/xylan/chitin deacetylase (PgdA/CDA1 family)
MKGIMYHYVRESEAEYPFFRHLHVEDFAKQLDYFQETFGFVGEQEFLDALQTGVPPKGVVLTFDDGVKDHYKYVYPLLKERGIAGVFYVPTFMFEGKMLDVHRIHLLLGKYESKLMYEKLLGLVTEDMLIDNNVEAFKAATYTKQKNDDYTLAFKRTLNYTIGYAHRTAVIDSLMREFFPNEEELKKTFYVTPAELREMKQGGMIIGSHSKNHFVMSKLNRDEQIVEIADSFTVLETHLGGLPYRTFCYPYGGAHTFTAETEQILEDNNCLYAFNVEARDVESHDLLHRRQALPRWDCNAFPFGQCR